MTAATTPPAPAIGIYLGHLISEILDFCVGEDRVCVTNNAGDFRELVGSVDLHPGLIVLPNVARESQLQLLEQALEVIEQRAEDARQVTARPNGQSCPRSRCDRSLRAL